MNKPIFCIVGKSGSGKSTYLDALIKDNDIKKANIKELKYHSTRSKRFPSEDTYFFTSYDDYLNTDKNDIIEKREYEKYDEKVAYYTTKSDLNRNDCSALICAASIDQALSYYNSLDNVYIINIYVNTKERLLRLINRCKTENDCYEVCRRTIEEDTEYNKLFEFEFGDNLINIDNSDMGDNFIKINKNYIKECIFNILSNIK